MRWTSSRACCRAWPPSTASPPDRPVRATRIPRAPRRPLPRSPIMYWKLRLLLGLVVLAGVARLCAFTVDRTEFVSLTQFGEHIATYDGADASQAGLHFRLPWPIQSVTRIDRRLQVLDLQPSEHVTQDPREGGTI